MDTSHWLEDAEREEQQKRLRPLREGARIQDKIHRVKENYEANHELYDEFIAYLADLSERANNLPTEKKHPWMNIEHKKKESKYENNMYGFSTAERISRNVITKAFPFVKTQHYKHVHNLYVSVSKKMGLAEVEVWDDYLAKTRLNLDDGKETEVLMDDGLPRLRVVFEYPIKQLDKQLAYKILDWLAFKSDVKSLPFNEEHFKYDKRNKR
jgi:hypothetical protein